MPSNIKHVVAFSNMQYRILVSSQKWGKLITVGDMDIEVYECGHKKEIDS